MCMCKGFSYKNTTQSSEVNIMFQLCHLLPYLWIVLVEKAGSEIDNMEIRK